MKVLVRFALAGAVFVLGIGWGHADEIIARWTFDSPVRDNNPLTGSLVPDTGTGTLFSFQGATLSFAPGAAAATIPPLDPDDSALHTTNYAMQPFLSVPLPVRGIEFHVSTSGFHPSGLTLSQHNAANASGDFSVQTSTDGGAIWQALSDYSVSLPDHWTTFAIPLGPIPHSGNNGDLRFRVFARPTQHGYYSSTSARTIDEYSPNAAVDFDLISAHGTSLQSLLTTVHVDPFDQDLRFLRVALADGSLHIFGVGNAPSGDKTTKTFTDVVDPASLSAPLLMGEFGQGHDVAIGLDGATAAAIVGGKKGWDDVFAPLTTLHMSDVANALETNDTAILKQFTAQISGLLALGYGEAGSIVDFSAAGSAINGSFSVAVPEPGAIVLVAVVAVWPILRRPHRDADNHRSIISNLFLV